MMSRYGSSGKYATSRSWILNSTFRRAAEVREDLSRATLRISLIGFALISKIERTACLLAIATSGRIRKPGIVAYAAVGMIPISAEPSANIWAQFEGTV